MVTYAINPYVSFVESRLFPQFVQYAVFHRLTGEIFEPSERVREVLLAIKSNSKVSTNGDDDNSRSQLQHLIQNQFLVSEGFDPLAAFGRLLGAAPIQNPAVAYRSNSGEWT